MILAATRVVTPSEVISPGWLEVVDGVVSALGEGHPPGPVDREFASQTIVPGFVDMHVHGGGGHSYTDVDAGQVRRGVAFHRSQGTTTTLASLVSAHPAALLEQIEELAPLVGDDVIAGIHLEGPWLSELRCGAHDPATLRTPDKAEIATVLEVARGSIAMVTIAPELPGAFDAIAQFVDAGVLVAVGHTDADYATVRAAIDRGARVATHLFNAMRPLHHREPGPILALLEDPRVTIEIVGDGVHVHRDLVSYVSSVAGPSRVALVTDAMAAAGMTDGSYRLGVLDVDVVDSVARLRTTGAIAGSTASMAILFRRAATLLAEGPAARGVDDALLAAVEMTSATGARALGLSDRGFLEVGKVADLVVVDDEYEVSAVMRAGKWLRGK